MIEPGISRTEGYSWLIAPPEESRRAGALRERAEPHAHVRLSMRRMRYYRDLLAAGYRHALSPDPQSRSLRAERIALGIDLPELDTVPLWSARRADGMISIPFVEFLLAQICQALDEMRADPGLASHEAEEDLAAARRALAAVLSRSSAGSEPAPSLPRLSDVYLSQGVLEQLCRDSGLLDQIVRRCEAVLGGSPQRVGS